MLRFVGRFLRLPARERDLVVRAFVSIGMIDMAIRARGFRGVLQHAPRVARAAETVDPADFARALEYAHAIWKVARNFPVRAECLHRSLTLHYWLRREGMPSELKVGVMLDGSELQAHAWVELDGRPVGDSSAEVAAFAPLRGRGGLGVESLVWSGS